MKRTATVEATEIVPAASADDATALAQIDGLDDMPDGLGRLRPEDVKIRSYVVNMKGTSQVTGRKIPEDEYYDTLDETSKPTVDAVILLRRATRAYTYFDNAEQRTKRVCASRDEVTGRMADGTTRPCRGCPDWAWKQVDGKPHRNCGPVMNLFMYDREAQVPFVLRAKRTSLPVAQTYLQRHHIGGMAKLTDGAKSGNVPLFIFQCQLSCKMEPGGKYALPVLTRGRILPSAEVQRHKVNAMALSELLDAMLDQLESAGDQSEAPPDTSFDPNSFGGAPSTQGFSAEDGGE